jgi:hypothetical protein
MRSARPTRGRIIVTGMAVYVPLPGVIYQILHYLIGLRRLGYEAYYIEDNIRWVYDSVAQTVVPDPGANVAIVAAALDSHGFADHWGYRCGNEVGRCYGMTEAELASLYRDADALLNVTGQTLEGDQLTCRRRIYIESDPFASQVRLHRGDADELARVSAHDTHFTFGENIGAADCGIPATQIDWLPTRQPVDVELWHPPAGTVATDRYTTITTWENHVDAIIHDGETYHWRKDREFEKFLDLPRRTQASFEIALNVDDDVLGLLASYGWKYAAANEVAMDTDSYRAYVWGSRGEFTVARDQYVRPRTGWFSDRSACYLAAGRPVITQETSFSKFLPTGCGLFAFTTLDEIVAAVDRIETNYAAHARAAREIAAEYFAAEKVVGRLMTQAGL